MSDQPFWKPEPKQPWHDWRTYSMLVPIVSGTIGACIFMALGFSFTEMASIPAGVKTWMVITASFAVAIGSTFGSIGSGIEVFRKRFKKEVEAWDWISLGISTLTTVAGFGMGFAALLGATTTWSKVGLVYGSIVVGTLAALDSLGDMIELGGLLGSYELRLNEYEQWRAQTGQSVVFDQDKMDREIQALNAKLGAVTEHIMEVEDRWTWPTATLADFKPILEGMNGGAATLDREILAMKLSHDKLNPPSSSTVDRWLKMVNVG